MSAGFLVRRAALFLGLSVALPVGAIAMIDPSTAAFRTPVDQRRTPAAIALTQPRERAQDVAAIGCERRQPVCRARGVSIGVSQ